MVMRAHVLVAGMADQDRPGHQLERSAAAAAAEAAFAHIGDGEGGMQLDERRVARCGVAPVVDHRDRVAPQ